jgi:hypothetical protein
LLTEQLPKIENPAQIVQESLEELNIRVKTMDSKEFQLALNVSSTVNDLKSVIEEVNL